MVVVHQIQWWRLCSTTHLWTQRWLRSPSPEAQSLNSGHTGSQLLWSLLRLLCSSSEFLASSLFKVGSSSLNRALPFWFVHDISLQFSLIDVAPLEIGFDRVFIPKFWSTMISFAGLKFPVHQASRHPTLLHSNRVSNPSKLGLDDGGLSLIEDLQIGDVVLPPDSQDRVESLHVEKLQFLDMPAMQCPHLTTIEEGGKNHGIVDLQFHRSADVVFTEHSIAETA